MTAYMMHTTEAERNEKIMLEKDKVERLREEYPKGTKVRLISMNDPYPVPEGTKGTVINVDDVGTVHVRWENGSSLGLIEHLDRWEKIDE